MHSPCINCGKKTDVQGEALCKLTAEAGGEKSQLKSEEGHYCWIPAADNRHWAAFASRFVEDTRLEIKVQNYPALVFAFLCWCNVADWPSLALNMMLSVLRIFLNQHWRVAARKVEVAVSQSCFCRKGDCLKWGGCLTFPFFKSVSLRQDCVILFKRFIVQNKSYTENFLFYLPYYVASRQPHTNKWCKSHLKLIAKYLRKSQLQTRAMSSVNWAKGSQKQPYNNEKVLSSLCLSAIPQQ